MDDICCHAVLAKVRKTSVKPNNIRTQAIFRNKKLLF